MTSAVAFNNDFNNIKWGDIEDDDILPPSQVLGPDKDGIKTLIDYFKNGNGELMKKTQKLKTKNIQRKVFKVAQQKKTFQPFGEAVGQSKETSIQQTEEVYLDFIKKSGAIGESQKPKRVPQQPKPQVLQQQTQQEERPQQDQGKQDRYIAPKYRGAQLPVSNEYIIKISNFQDSEESREQIIDIFKQYKARNVRLNENYGTAFFANKQDAQYAYEKTLKMRVESAVIETQLREKK